MCRCLGAKSDVWNTQWFGVNMLLVKAELWPYEIDVLWNLKQSRVPMLIVRNFLPCFILLYEFSILEFDGDGLVVNHFVSTHTQDSFLLTPYPDCGVWVVWISDVFIVIGKLLGRPAVFWRRISCWCGYWISRCRCGSWISSCMCGCWNMFWVQHRHQGLSPIWWLFVYGKFFTSIIDQRCM